MPVDTCSVVSRARATRASSMREVCWATEYHGIGNSYGYSVYNARCRQAIEAAGVRLDPAAAVALHVAPSHRFEPVPGKLNVLYMAWETEALPAGHRRGIERADAVVVTASFLLPVVQAAVPQKPVFLCSGGVDTDLYAFRRRARPAGRPFRFLWVGAPNARKGWELVIETWRPFLDHPRAELYIKTTVTGRFDRYRNVLFDSRDLPAAELAALYHSAHAFLFPSFGEGFGLTMAEAMATGLPVVYTPWSSLNDLADASCAYPVRHRMVPAWATSDGGLVTTADPPAPDAVPTEVAQAEVGDLADRMVEVLRHYPRAAERGAAAARRIRSRFTWHHVGRRLAQIVAALSGETDALL